MQFLPAEIISCYEVRPDVYTDKRGRFIKIFSQSVYTSAGLRTDWKEEYYSVSSKNVIRGMHFQVPPYQHAKLVTCLQGEIRDVVVDLRKGSPTYQQCHSVVLSSITGNCLYIPEGLAHGFLSLTDNVLVAYKVTSEYQPDHDAGVLWNSLEYDWGIDEPVVSDRDAGFPSLKDMETPFL